MSLIWPASYSRNRVFSLLKPLVTLNWMDSATELSVYLRGQCRWHGRVFVNRGLKNLGLTVGDDYPTLRQWLSSPFTVIDTQTLRTEMSAFLEWQFTTHPNRPWQRFRDIKKGDSLGF